MVEVDPHRSSHEHDHAQSIRSFSVELKRAVDPDRFRDVMSFLIMRHAENLLRIKGLVRFDGQQGLRLVNGVHDVFSSSNTCNIELPNSAQGAIVFIGIDLPEDVIRTDILSCYSREALAPQHR